MNIDELSNRLDKELGNVYNTVLINGEWGIGKTYFLKEKYSQPRPLEKRIYISLFGIVSMYEFEMQILDNLGKISNFFRKIYSAHMAGKSILYKRSDLTLPVTLPAAKVDAEKSVKNKAKNEKLIFIIDDIERKSDNIKMGDLLGSIERISQIYNVNVIVVTNENKMNENDYKVFKAFKEKVINKTYNIDKFSKRAPQKIIEKELKNDKYNIKSIIEKLFKQYDIKNLRTLEKCVHFINQGIKYIDFSKLEEKQINEIVGIEMAVAIEKNNEKFNVIYKSDEENTFDYMNELLSTISRKYFNGVLFENKNSLITLTIQIFDDFDVKENYEQINLLYANLNSLEVNDVEKIDPFYLSEAELKERVIIFNNKYMNKVVPELNINTWFKKLNYLYKYAKIVALENSFKESDILNTIDLYIEKIDVSKNLYQFKDHFLGFEIEDEKMKEYLETINKKIQIGYYDKLLEEVQKDITKGKYDIDKYEKLFSGIGEENNTELMKKLKENEYLIPDLNNELSEYSWRFTHTIWSKMRYLNDKNDFIEILNKRIEQATRLGKYRIESLNEQYGINMEIV